jgi:ubiquinone/menaquinone biosynthesis C-methylase UbiE
MRKGNREKTAMKRGREWEWSVLLLAALAAPWPLAAQQSGTGTPPAKEKSVPAGINDTWKSENIDPLVARLETESREIYHERVKLAALAGAKPGMRVADVGAGSGFMVEEFAKLVGPQGKVYAVDINAKMLAFVAQRAKEKGLGNVETQVTREDSVDLPASSVDLVFVCDTYHHFEYPQASLAGIHRALRAGGELVVVDFERVAGKVPDWMIEHVRGGKEVFTREITAAGFELVAEEKADFLKENYVLRFRRVEKK